MHGLLTRSRGTLDVDDHPMYDALAWSDLSGRGGREIQRLDSHPYARHSRASTYEDFLSLTSAPSPPTTFHHLQEIESLRDEVRKLLPTPTQSPLSINLRPNLHENPTDETRLACLPPNHHVVSRRNSATSQSVQPSITRTDISQEFEGNQSTIISSAFTPTKFGVPESSSHSSDPTSPTRSQRTSSPSYRRGRRLAQVWCAMPRFTQSSSTCRHREKLEEFVVEKKVDMPAFRWPLWRCFTSVVGTHSKRKRTKLRKNSGKPNKAETSNLSRGHLEDGKDVGDKRGSDVEIYVFTEREYNYDHWGYDEAW